MSHIWYRTSEGPAFEFCQDWKQRRRDAAEAIMAWVRQHGGNNFIEGSGPRVIGGWPVNAILCEGKPTTPGWKLDKRRSSDGREMWRPHQGNAAGRALAKEMQSLPSMPAMDEFCDHFGFPHGFSYRGDKSYGSAATNAYSFTTCQIGWVSNEYWIVLPDLEAIFSDYEARGYTVETPRWSPPEGLRPASRAQYDLEMAKAAVAEERAA